MIQDKIISLKNKQLIEASVAPNTLKNYQNALRQLETWLRGHPLSDPLLSEYVSKLYHEGKAPATCEMVLKAVKWKAKIEGSPLDKRDVQITDQALKGIRREGKDRGRESVNGLEWEDVEKVCARAEADDTVAGFRDSALIRLMSDCLLRISEAVVVNIDYLARSETGDGSTLLIRSSKTDQEGHGEHKFVGEPTMQVIKRYIETGAINEVALFRRVRFQQHICPGRLSVNGARGAIKRRAREAGVAGFISGHSLRVGSTISLAKAGRLLWIYRWQVDGNHPKCRHITRVRCSQNKKQSHGSNTKNDGFDIAIARFMMNQVFAL